MVKSIFISSTSRDLIFHRKEVKEVIERLEHRPIDMVNFGSRSGDAVDISLDQVGKADIFIGIIAHRYGYVPDEMDKSVTEQEYDEAVRRGIPRLMYLVSPDIDWYEQLSEQIKAHHNVDDDDVKAILLEQNPLSQQRLFQFKMRIEKETVRSVFDTPEDLGSQVAADLSRLFAVQNRRRRLMNFAPLVVFLLTLLILISFIFIADLETTNSIVESFGLATATPLEGEVAGDDEIVVVVAEFEQSDGSDYEPEINIQEVVQELANDIGNIRVISVGHSIVNVEEATELSDIYQATMVIYGRISSGGVSVSYQITPNVGVVRNEVEGDFRIAVDQVENFEAFLFDGMDTSYFVGLTAGQVLYFQDDYDAAIRAFDLAIDAIDASREAEFQTSLVYVFRGDANRSLENYEDSLVDYERALELNPNSAIAYAGIGTTYRRLEQDELAIENLTHAIEVDPEEPMGYFQLAGYYTTTDEYELAIENYNQARTFGMQPEWWVDNNLAWMHVRADDYETALVYAEASYAASPDDYFSLYRMGNVHYNLRNMDESLDYYEQASVIRPDDYWVLSGIGNVYYQQGDYDRAIEQYLLSLESDPESQYTAYQLALSYSFNGNYEESIPRYELLAEQEYIAAYNGLGSAYLDGNGVPQDDNLALEWYMRAAEAGNSTGQFNTGVMYQNGTGVEKDYAVALGWYELAAEQDNGDAVSSIGYLYKKGWGVEQNDSESMRWYERGAELNDAHSFYNLASNYYEGEIVEHDIPLAISYFEATLDYAQPGTGDDEIIRFAGRRLGDIYRTGEEVEADDDLATVYYQIAANSGDIYSQGALYEYGYGVDQDYAEAARLYIRAANVGQKLAILRLIEFYTEGLGVEADADEAARWQLNSEYNAKRFTVPVFVEGQEERVPMYVYIIEAPRNPDNPMEEEIERLWNEHQATIPEEVVDSFTRLYEIAVEQDVSYIELLIYALEAADNDDGDQ